MFRLGEVNPIKSAWYGILRRLGYRPWRKEVYAIMTIRRLVGERDFTITLPNGRTMRCEGGIYMDV